MVLDINSSSKYWHCSFPVICECGKQIQSNSLFNHRKSKAHILEMQNPYWIPISCLAILQGISKQHVWERMIHRIVGTFIGIGICWLILLVCTTPLSICISIFILQYLVEVLIVKNYALAIIFITPMTILLAEIGSSFTANTEIMISARFLDITIGSVIGFMGGWLIYNQRFKNEATHHLRKVNIFIRKSRKS